MNLRFPGHTSTYPSQHDANLVLSSQRHQKDLFTGGASNLGIPDISTHVGSVIHAFENLAYQRQLKEGAEKPYESSKSSSNSVKRETTHKIILPPSKKSIGTLTIDSHQNPPKYIVRHRAKGKAPEVPSTHRQSSSTNTVSATTQTTKVSGDENESSAMESFNMFDDYLRRSANKFPHSYIRNHKVLPPFETPSTRAMSKIPVSKATASAATVNRNNKNNQSKPRKNNNKISPTRTTDVFLRPTAIYTETEIENDFLRGSEVSQSFIKNVVRKTSPHRKLSTYEQNFLMNTDTGEHDRVGRKSKVEKPLIDEVSARYTEYKSDNRNNQSSSLYNNHQQRQTKNQQQQQQQSSTFHPRSVDRAEL